MSAKKKPGRKPSRVTREAQQFVAGLLTTDQWSHGVWTVEELLAEVKKSGRQVSKAYLYRIVERLGYERKWVRR